MISAWQRCEKSAQMDVQKKSVLNRILTLLLALKGLSESANDLILAVILAIILVRGLLPNAASAATPKDGPEVRANDSKSQAASQSQGQNLTLLQAVREAVEKNPQLLEAKEKVNQSDAQIPVTRASLLPNVSLVGSAAEKKDAVNSGFARFGGDPYNNYSADLRLTQPLFVYGSVEAVNVAHRDRDLRRLDREIVQRDLIIRTAQAYFQVVLNLRNLETLKLQQKIVNESALTAERRSHTGRGQVIDALQVRTQLALLQSQISDAENQIQISVATLANVLSDQEGKPVQVRNWLEVPDLPEVDRALGFKTFELPELEKNKIAVEQIDSQKKIALGQQLPSLTLAANYLYFSTKQSEFIDGKSASWGLGVNLTIPIFVGWMTHYQQQVLNSQRSQLQHSRTWIQDNAKLQQVTSRKRLETAAISIRQGKEALRLATASSEEARRMYRLSTIDFVQFLQVQKDYIQAEQALNSYKFNYLSALISYFAAAGQDLGRLVEYLEVAAKANNEESKPRKSLGQ